MSQTSRLAEEFEHTRSSLPPSTAKDVPPQEQLSNPRTTAPGRRRNDPANRRLGPRIAIGVVVETMRICWWTSLSVVSYLFRQRGGTDRNVRLANSVADRATSKRRCVGLVSRSSRPPVSATAITAAAAATRIPGRAQRLRAALALSLATRRSRAAARSMGEPSSFTAAS